MNNDEFDIPGIGKFKAHDGELSFSAVSIDINKKKINIDPD